MSRPGASLVIVVFGKREDTEAAPYFAAIGSLLPPPPPGTPGPFALSSEGALEALVTQAGMPPGKVEEFDCPWEYPDDKYAPARIAFPRSGHPSCSTRGEAVARDAVLKALAPFKTAAGGYKIRNKVRYMIAKT